MMKNILTQEQINDIEAKCVQYKIEKYSINNDGSIDVVGDVDISKSKLTNIPLIFNRVSGFFSCCTNDLTSLDGCPVEVGDFFDCSENPNLTSLKGCPEKIGAGAAFMCDDCDLTSFEFLPSIGASYLSWSGIKRLPKEFCDYIYNVLDTDQYEVLPKYLSYYDVWEDGVYQENNMKDLVDDILDGLK